MEKTKAQRAGEFRDNLVFENTETPDWEYGYREGLFVGYVKGANEQEKIDLEKYKQRVMEYLSNHLPAGVICYPDGNQTVMRRGSFIKVVLEAMEE